MKTFRIPSMDTILTSDFTKISFQNARFYISSVLNDKVSSLTVFTIPICLKLQLVLIHIQFGHANYDCFSQLIDEDKHCDCHSVPHVHV